MRKAIRLFFSTTILALGLAGCSMSGLMTNVVSAVGEASKGEPFVLIDLVAPGRFAVRQRLREVNLTVYQPTASTTFERNSVIVKSPAQEVSILSGVKWSDKLPRLIQMRFMETFENSQAVGSVSNGRDQINSNFALRIHIRSFQVNADENSATAVVALYAKLIHKNSGKVIKQKLFTSEHHVNLDDHIVTVRGLNQGFQSVASNIVKWVARLDLEDTVF